jgi:PAS domain S-box-containing protein
MLPDTWASRALQQSPNIWEHYPGLVVAAAAAVVILVPLMAALLVHRRDSLRYEAAMGERLRFERLVSEISATLIGVSPDRVNDEVHAALHRVLEAMGLDRCTVFVLCASEGWARVTHEAERPGLPPFPREWKQAQVPIFFRALHEGHVLSFARIPKDIPEEARAERHYMHALGLKSLLMIPVTVSGGLVRGMTFGAIRAYRDWPADLVSRLHLVGNILISTVAGKRAEAALRQSEERLREVVDSQTELICRYLPDTTLTFVNEAYCRYFARSRDELIGRRFLELIPEDAREAQRLHVESLVENPRVVKNEHEVLRADGSIAWQEWVDHAVRGRDGRVVEFQAIGRDVTDRKRAEEATRNLAHAARLSMLGELTASIAHQINQPLGAILANADAAELMMERPDAHLDQIRPILTEIRRENLRASDVIRHVRSLVRRRDIERYPLDFNDIARDVVRLVGSDAHRRGVACVTELAERLPSVSGDRVWLEQVLLNLVLNGIEAMEEAPRDDRQLTVRTKANGGRTIEVSVVDTGHGIPETLLPRLFDSFVTTRKDGMGLGLSISRSILEAHGGAISAENNAGRGATVRFTLPAV